MAVKRTGERETGESQWELTWGDLSMEPAEMGRRKTQSKPETMWTD